MKDLNIFRKKAIDFLHSAWGKDCLGNQELDIGTENFEKIADAAFNKLIKDKKNTKNPFIFRTAGQSGSGKTTQLLPSIQNIIDKKNKDFINISVRIFSTYHPYYNELLNKYGQELIREKTNGFALFLAFRVIEKLIKNKYNILFEITILDNDFELYLSRLAKTNRYKIHFHILSVPKVKSDYWIEKRKQNSITEGNRIVLKSSSNFFYDVLPNTLSKIINYHFWSKNDMIFLWTGFLECPVQYNKIYKNKEFLKVFNEYRNYNTFKEKNEEYLLNYKKKWFENYYV